MRATLAVSCIVVLCFMERSLQMPGIFLVEVKGTCCGATCQNGSMTCVNDTLECFCVLEGPGMLLCTQHPEPQTNGCGEDATCNGANRQCTCMVHRSFNRTGLCANQVPVPTSDQTSQTPTTDGPPTVGITDAVNTVPSPLVPSTKQRDVIIGASIGTAAMIVLVLAILLLVRLLRRRDNPQTEQRTRPDVIQTAEQPSHIYESVDGDYLTPVYHKPWRTRGDNRHSEQEMYDNRQEVNNTRRQRYFY